MQAAGIQKTRMDLYAALYGGIDGRGNERGAGMRELKFRVWDNVENEFLTGWKTNQLVIRPLSGRVTDGGTTPNVILLQYTGLEDRNGKEIYEGDIVEYGLLTGEIVFESGSFQLEIMKSEYSGLIGTRDCLIDLAEDGFEIVGNVFEHSDLLDAAE